MKQITQSSFNEGLLMDMNPLVTPQTCLSDCLNGTIITFNGNEFTLQNDSGNIAIKGGDLPNGFIPVGMKEYGGIIYTALLNPITNICQLGSIPSPDYSKQAKDQSEEGVVISFDGVDFKDNITKLFEFEQFALNPGDKYKIVYTISEDSKDISKIYKVKWIAIDESGKEYDLNSPNIVDSIDGEFAYFNQTIKAVLGLEITLNNINWFEVAANSYKTDNDQFSIKLQLYGKNRIQYTGSSEDDLFIRGCKIEYDENTEYIWDEDALNSQLNNQIITEDSLKIVFDYTVNLPKLFDANEEVNLTVTPFDQFKMLDELKRNIFLKMGEIQTSDSFNELFQYKYSSENKSLRLDFNANLKGINDPKVYLEFYDVWSDYSVIVPINDPNPFGKNSVFISTSSEKCSRDFNEFTRGGIDVKQLEVFNTNTEYIPTLYSNERLVRKNQILRENNLYIVKISIIENSSDVNTRAYHNTYKVLTLNENMNDKYREYELTENPLFKDFSKIPQNISDLKVKHSSLDIVDETPVINSSDSTLSLKTNNYYYKLTDEDLQTNNSETCVKSISKTRFYNMKLSLDAESIGYGVVDGFSLSENVELNNLNKNIIETDENITSTNSEVAVVSSSNNNITIKNILTTTRNINAEIKKELRDVRSVKSTTRLWDKMVVGNNEEPSGYLQLWKNRDHPRKITNGNGTTEIVYDNSSIRDQAVTNYFRIMQSRSSGGVLHWANTPNNNTDPWGDEHDHWCDSRVNGSLIPDHINNYLICLLNKDGNFYPVFINDKGAAIDVLKNIYSSVVKDTNYRLYYYGNITADKESTSQTKPEFTISSASNINFVQYSHFSKSDFNQSNILDQLNNIINISEGTSETDYISQESNSYLQVINTSGNINFSIKLDKFEITDTVDKAMLNKLSNSLTDLEFNESSKLINSNIPNFKPYSTTYPSIANKFDATYENSDTSEPINPVFTFKHGNLQKTRWIVGSHGDSNDYDGYKIDTNIFEL